MTLQTFSANTLDKPAVFSLSVLDTLVLTPIAPAPGSNVVKGLKIFRVGTFTDSLGRTNTWTQEDLEAMPAEGLEAIRKAGLRLGLSTHGYAEMLIAERHSPSYIAMGAVFPTTLKRMATAPQGLARLNAYARLLRGHTLVAIGGIDAERMPAVLQSGVGSVAVVRAITGAADPEAAALALHDVLRSHLI